MSDSEKTPSPKKASASTSSAKRTSPNPKLDAAFAEAARKGFFGTTPDTTPNRDYTVAGVAKKGTK